ncbi:hypothetical protein GCM10028807_45760 [Spirosoma daeguense]
MGLLLFFSTQAIAQSTLATEPLPLTSVCPGSTIDVTGFRDFPSESMRIELSNGGSYYEIPSEFLSASGRYEITYRATIPGNTPAGTTYRIRIVSKNPDLAGTPSATVLTVRPTATAPGVASATYCQGTSSVQVSATATTGGTLNWYSTATGATILPAAPTVSTSNVGVATYHVSQSVTGFCESPRVAVSVTVQPTPLAPSIPQATVSICQNTTATSLTATGQNLKWYDVATGGTAVAMITPNTASVGSKTYYVSQTVNGCESTRTSVTVNIQETPVAPSVTQASYSVCVGTSLAISGTIAPGLSASWQSYGDTPALTNTSTNGNTATANVPTDIARTLTYSLMQVSANTCRSPASATITVTVKSVPSAPSVQSVSVCQGATAPVLQATGSNLLWYTGPTSGTGTSVTPVVNTSIAGQQTFFVSQVVNGCESARAVLPVTVSNQPAAPSVASPIVSVCQFTPAQTLTANGSNLRWYDVATGGSPLGSTPQIDPTVVSSKMYYVSQTVGNCEGPRTALTATVRKAPDAPSPVKTDYEFCEGETQTVISFTAASASESRRWVVFRATTKEMFMETTTANAVTSLAVNVPNTFSPTSASSTSSTESYGAYIIDVTGCASTTSAAVAVKTKARPSAPETLPVSICQNSPVQSLTAAGQNLLWYTNISGGSSTSIAPAVSTSLTGQTSYYVSQTREGCESSRSVLSVTVKALPSAPGVIPKTICATAPVENASASGENLTWYNSDGSKLGSAPPVINTDKGASYTLLVTQTVNGCEGAKASLQVNVVAPPLPAVAKTLVEVCQGTAPQALSATGTNLKWTDPNGNVTTIPPTPPTATPTAKVDGDVYYVTQTVNGCESAKVPIKVFVQAMPRLTLSGSTTANIGIEVPLKLTFVGVGPYQYKLSNGLSGTATKDTTILVTPTQTTTYQVTEIMNKCGSGPTGAATAATVTVLVPTIQTLALTSTTLCVGSRLTTNFQTTGAFNPGSVFKLQVAKVETDTTKMSYVDVPVSQSANGQVSGLLSNTLAEGFYWVRVVATNPKIPINGRISPTVLNVRPLATATLTGNPTVYEGQPAKLTLVLTGDAPWTFAYRDSTSAGTTMTVQATASPYALEVRPMKTSTYVLSGVSNSCGAGSITGRVATVTVTPLLGIEEQLLVDAVEVFPVPATTTLTVRIRGISAIQPATLELTDMNGKTIRQQETNQVNSSIPLDNYPVGTYLLRIRVGDRTAAKRIVKM